MKRGFVLVVVVAGLAGLMVYGARKLGRSDEPARPAGPPPAVSADDLPMIHGAYEPATGPSEAPPADPAPADQSAQRPPSLEIAGALKKADELAASGQTEKMMEARGLLTGLILNAAEGPDRDALRKRLDALNARLFFSPLPTPDSVIHTVAQGDVLWTIKNRYRSSVELIQKVNSLSGTNIRAGQTLKVPQGVFSARVDRERFRLIVLLNGHYIKEYRVGIGKDDLTPAGDFEIEKMATNPSWTDPTGRVHPFGDPENPLGARWLGFKPAGGRSGLGIHGTADDASIGTKCSSGCIRLRNVNVEELYGMLNLNDKVLVE